MPRRAAAAKPGANGAGRHGLWSGTVSFGLVSIPVSLFPANRPGGARMRLFTPDGAPVARQYVCPKDERVLTDGEIVRGYEVRKGRYVVVTDEELERLAPRASRDIELQQFVPLAELDPLYFERGYYVAPGRGSAKAYGLLTAVMERTERAGIATFVMRERAYVVALIAERGLLRAETLRFADEVRRARDAGVPAAPRTPAKRAAALARLVAQLGKRQLDPDELVDGYAERVERLARRKLAAKCDVVEVAEPVEPEGEEAVDLVQVLRAALGRRGGTRQTGRGRRGPSRGRTPRPVRGRKRRAS